MANIKKLYFANGTDVTEALDLAFPATVYANDAAYVAVNGPAVDGDFYLNSTLKALRVYSNGAWRSTIMATDAADATKLFGVDLTSATTGTTATIKFNNTTNKTYTFPDFQGEVVLTVGSQSVDGKTMTNVTLDEPLITGGSIDVTAAGPLAIGSSVGANNLTLGGAASTVIVQGDLTVQGTTTTINTANLDVEDKNITVNKGGSDASSEGAGLTVDRVGADGSLIYKDAAPNKFAIGTLGAEKDIATMFDITAANLSGVVTPANGGTGVSNNNAATLTRVGNHAVTLTTTGTTSLTLPTSGTLARVEDIGSAGVYGPAVTTNGSIAVWDNTTGTLLRNTPVTMDSLGQIDNCAKLVVDSIQLDSATIQTVSANTDLYLSASGTGVVRSLKTISISQDGGVTLGDSANTYSATIKCASTMTNSRIHRIPNQAGDLVLDSATQNLLNKSVSSTGALTGALTLPAGTTADRSGLTTQGMVRYNTTLSTFEGYNGTDWGAIGGGGGGTIDTVTQAGHGFVVGDVLYLNGSTYTKAIATSSAAAEVVGMVSRVISSSQFDITLSGEVTGLSGLTVGEAYFLSAATAGAITATEPSTIGQVSVPIGVASSATSLYVAPKRGVVIGGVNARTEVALTSGAVTNVQDVAGMTAGELAGWVFISSSPAKRFYVSAQFALTGAGGDYNLSYQTSGDAPPAGFLVDITTTGMIRVTLPASSGSTSVINYALNAPAIGASLPLTLDASRLLSGTVPAARLPAPTVYADAEATMMGLKQYLHGGSYKDGLAPTISGSGVSVIRALFIPYQVQDGTWRLKFNLAVTATSTTSLTLSVNGIVTKNVTNYFQAISNFPGGNYGRGYMGIGTNTIILTSDLSTTSYSASGDIELNSKPTWAY